MTFVFYVILDGQWLDRNGKWIDMEQGARAFRTYEFALSVAAKHPGARVIQRASL